MLHAINQSQYQVKHIKKDISKDQIQNINSNKLNSHCHLINNYGNALNNILNTIREHHADCLYLLINSGFDCTSVTTKWTFSTGMLLSGGGKGDCLLRIPVIFLGMIISILLRSSLGESAFSESEETITFSTFFSSLAALSYLEDIHVHVTQNCQAILILE